MALFQSLAAAFVPPRDDLTLPQFILDDLDAHFTKPTRQADVPCLIEDESGRALYVAELQHRTHTLAGALKCQWDIGAGDVVSLYAPNHIDYAVIAWAVHRLGGIVATHSPTLTSDELVYQFRKVRPMLVVAHPDNLSTALHAMKQSGVTDDRLALLDGELAPGTPFPSIESLIQHTGQPRSYTEKVLEAGQAKTTIAFLCFSSGTTGKPKAVSISHFNVICNVIQCATFNRISEPYARREERRFRPGDICSGVLPLYHIYGLVVNLHFVLYSAMTLVISKKFNFDNFLGSIQRHRITHLMIVPPQAVLFCKHPSVQRHDLSSVRYLMIAAAPVSAELTEQLLGVFPAAQLGQGYGMTETCATISMFPTSQKVGTLGSGGQLVSGTTAKVVKPNGELAKIGERGELYVTGPQVTLGYYLDDEATRTTFIDGWIRTGDEVMIQENGDLFITDRIKELIKVKGNQVAPSELEGYLLNHSDVADAAVIGVHDEYAGELPRAYVALKPHVAAVVQRDQQAANHVRAKLYEHVASRTSRYKWLDGGIEFLNEIPKNASGKILRRVLREVSNRATPLANRSRL
ncbi:phenylacetyl-CoA ligase [Dichomitus squalens]|uniref:Phenylacetyl-CoA ligase n=1 Tax=Dichomitus squalens TaxID=114155 RepID=A0A4V2K842_9APHY|nr:phenylacetyl-CoA ligase [Dichomitus squalens]